VWVYPPLAIIPRLWEFNGDAFMIIEKSHIDQNLCYTNQQHQSCGKKMAFPRKKIKIHS
jgi:hypothetical protein